MSFSVGIIGLPNAGKSTVFKALTSQEVDIEPYPFSTIDPNVGVVQIPDHRLDKVAETINSEKKTPTVIKFVDIAGLIKDAHKGEGLGNEFLAQIRDCDALLEIVRGFKGKNVKHVEKYLNPKRDISTVQNELLMKDLETVKNIIRKLGRKPNKEAVERKKLAEKIEDWIRKGRRIYFFKRKPEEKRLTKEWRFLTDKPLIRVLNTADNNEELKELVDIQINLEKEKELADLTEQEKEEIEEKSRLEEIITASYKALSLITFYTIAGGKETRAWTLKKGRSVKEAGGVVHSDFEEQFIKAEVTDWKKLIKAGRWKKAKNEGAINTVGKDYQVQDGDVIEFKI